MAKNPIIEKLGLKITPEFSFPLRVLLAILFIVFFPLMIPAAVLFVVLVMAFVLTGILSFWIVERIDKRIWLYNIPEFRWQWVRAFINNVIARNLPHRNTPFKTFLYRLTGITIGRHVFIGMNNYMEDYNTENVFIEDGVVISFNTTFIAHGMKRSKKTIEEKIIVVRSGAYIGARTTILPGVTIGEKAVVGAGSVVVKDIPPGAIAVGNPCKPIGWLKGWGPDGRIEQKEPFVPQKC